jgi:hypothetical protein
MTAGMAILETRQFVADSPDNIVTLLGCRGKETTLNDLNECIRFFTLDIALLLFSIQYGVA